METRSVPTAVGTFHKQSKTIPPTGALMYSLCEQSHYRRHFLSQCGQRRYLCTKSAQKSVRRPGQARESAHVGAPGPALCNPTSAGTFQCNVHPAGTFAGKQWKSAPRARKSARVGAPGPQGRAPNPRANVHIVDTFRPNVHRVGTFFADFHLPEKHPETGSTFQNPMAPPRALLKRCRRAPHCAPNPLPVGTFQKHTFQNVPAVPTLGAFFPMLRSRALFFLGGESARAKR